MDNGPVMTTPPARFGTKAHHRPPFHVNDTEFASDPLTLAEEMRLADTPIEALNAQDGASVQETQAAITALAGAVAELLQARSQTKGLTVDAQWVLENMTTSDLEGVVEYLRSVEG